ncbi:MAG TPA: peptidoglycan-binding domain-containing protein [Candidatus Paceibacterota bacterium]
MTHKINIAVLSAVFLVAPVLASAAVLSIQLEPGMTGSEVSALQTFLAADSSIYPEGLVTGFFGPLTEAAVKRYQTEFGISAVGRVGPITLASINGNSDTGGSDDVNASVTTWVIVSATAHSATIGWISNEPVFGRVMYGTGSNFVYASSPSIQSASGFNTSQVLAINGLMSNTRYYYILESVDVAGNITWTIGRSFITT